MLNHRIDAYELLRKLGASSHLICHLQLVGEAADELLQGYAELGVKIDSVLVELGAALHDAGKITHPSEIYGPGSLHELAGERLLLAQGVQPSVARCCVTHASWEKGELSLEERTVALADNLWKGKREPELELLIINQIASKLGHSMWDIFLHFDTLFERIATHGDIRLQRSRESSIRDGVQNSLLARKIRRNLLIFHDLDKRKLEF